MATICRSSLGKLSKNFLPKYSGLLIVPLFIVGLLPLQSIAQVSTFGDWHTDQGAFFRTMAFKDARALLLMNLTYCNGDSMTQTHFDITSPDLKSVERKLTVNPSDYWEVSQFIWTHSTLEGNELGRFIDLQYAKNPRDLHWALCALSNSVSLVQIGRRHEVSTIIQSPEWDQLDKQARDLLIKGMFYFGIDEEFMKKIQQEYKGRRADILFLSCLVSNIGLPQQFFYNQNAYESFVRYSSQLKVLARSYVPMYLSCKNPLEITDLSLGLMRGKLISRSEAMRMLSKADEEYAKNRRVYDGYCPKLYQVDRDTMVSVMDLCYPVRNTHD